MKKFYRAFLTILFVNLMFVGAANAQKLEGEWKLVQVKQEGKEVVFKDEIKTTAVFGKENRMSGNAGCNRYSTTYALENKGKISFEPIISTRMACLDDDFMKQESTFFGVMEKVKKYQYKGNSLTFFDDSKQNVLKFLRVYKQNSQGKNY